MKNVSLASLPYGTTIRFFSNGKERYIRKIRPGGRYWSSWYDPVRCESVKETSIPRNWDIL